MLQLTALEGGLPKSEGGVVLGPLARARQSSAATCNGLAPFDRRVSLGAPESYDTPEFDAAVRTVLRKARANGIGAGVFSMLGTQRVIDWAEDGLNFVVHSSDYAAMRDAISADVRVMREGMAHHCNGSPAPAVRESR